eukprot:CAMPEP_0197711630 /NCGR_PEP_ID=MMETSP1338-20131121/129551_1 /TAXON_ID=43686 ORGANISM="Pelagodinium beii, Strain RCC1491" /NCGR_SAMPLE_ID=MMETSP1338 /ASSEMBLY_ACC=CAM_ASM_000754 /LENGTH=56 /DNA_ID=CAMNT_0043295563 /DNA_START=1689 /DNA_END=1859 /DNA_ORIENTATION=+
MAGCLQKTSETTSETASETSSFQTLETWANLELTHENLMAWILFAAEERSQHAGLG